MDDKDAGLAGWRVMTSDEGRLWASRERPFTILEMAAGAARTVDGDDLVELIHAIAEQESVAEAARVPAPGDGPEVHERLL